MKILFITANRIGDAVLSTGLLRHVVERYPAATITIVCGSVAADLLRAVPNLEKLIILKKERYSLHWVKLWRACVGQRWDLIIDLRNSVVSRLLLAKQRAYRPARKTGQHLVVDNASALNLKPPPAPHLWLDDAAIRRAAELIGGTTNLIALGPAANWPAKQWPIENFVTLAKRLTAADGLYPNAKILVTAAPHEQPQLEPLLAALPASQIIPIFGEDLLTVAAALRSTKLFIGNDSGLMHMAAGMGVPTLGLFGPGYENIYGPYGTHTAIVRTPESTAELLARLPYPGAFAPNLMGSLTVEAVLAAAGKLTAQINR